MKILLVFIDMVRLDHLNIYNEKAIPTLLDKKLCKIGGTLFTRCYSPGPDTPRSMASMQTGLYPFYNGCDTRIKWPRYFIKEGVKTIWDIAANLGYNVNLCARQHHINVGLFHFTKHPNIKVFNSLERFVSESSFSNNNISFVCTPDVHFAIEDYGATNKGINEGFNMATKMFDRFITDEFIRNFDYTFIFSDHGLQTYSERCSKSSKIDLLNDGRNRLLMLMHRNGDDKIIKDNRLASMVDLFATIAQLIGAECKNSGFSFIDKPGRRIVHIEDHTNFLVSPEVMIKQWRVITDYYDVRTNVYNTIGCPNEEVKKEFEEYLYNNSPNYSAYVKQIKVWDIYANLKSQELDNYFVGDNRIGNKEKFIRRLFRGTRAWFFDRFGL